jgi:uncharacterized protein (TIGR02266 family)
MGDDKGAGAPSGRERRTSVRFAVEMWVEEVTNGNQVFRRAGNLSRGGLYLDQTIPIPIGTKVQLRFTLPEETTALQVAAEIVSINPTQQLGMGVKFLDPDASTLARIDDYLARLAQATG